MARGRCRAIVRVPWDDTAARSGQRPAVPLAAARRHRASPTPRWPASWWRAWPPRPSRGGPSSESRRKSGRSRLAIRYFDDRILLTDDARLGVLPAAHGVLRVHHARGARGAGHQHHRGPGRDPDAGRRGAPAHRAPALPGGRVGDRPGRHLRRRPRLAGVPGRDVPARLGQGLLVQGDLPRGPARPAGHAGTAVRRRVLPVHLSLYQAGEQAAGPGRRGGPRPARSPSGPSRPSGWAGRCPLSALAARHATLRRASPGCSGTR